MPLIWIFRGHLDKPVITQLDSTATINGMLCKIVRMQWKLGKVDYYYSEGQLAVNPELFSKHTADGLADFIRMSKSLPVQIVKNAMGLDLIQTLMASQQEEINSDLFSIPTLVSDSTLSVMKLPGVEIMRVKKE